MTTNELKTIAATASKICGCLWDDVDAVGTIAKLQAVLATSNPGGDADLTNDDRRALEVLLSVTDEAVYMLTDAETNDDLRDATVDELCESLLAGPEGFIEVDGRRCYVQTAVSY
ncbi:MAG TPA: hypothetical protein DDY91_24045 [Planctomycetaceae bacterium]|jgi:hypothetical protein|nr:hypothetical protein [Planctomycetaceae bacterium]